MARKLMNFRTCLILVALLSATPAAASRPDFTYLGAGYIRQHLSADVDCDQDGLYLEGSMAFNEFLYAQVRHVDVTSDSWCGSTTSAVSFGARLEVGMASALYGQGTVLYRDYGRKTSFGLGMLGGFRSILEQGLEVSVFVGHESVGAAEQTYFGGGLDYWFGGGLSINGTMAINDQSSEILTLGLRYSF